MKVLECHIMKCNFKNNFSVCYFRTLKQNGLHFWSKSHSIVKLVNCYGTKLVQSMNCGKRFSARFMTIFLLMSRFRFFHLDKSRLVKITLSNTSSFNLEPTSGVISFLFSVDEWVPLLSFPQSIYNWYFHFESMGLFNTQEKIRIASNLKIFMVE